MKSINIRLSDDEGAVLEQIAKNDHRSVTNLVKMWVLEQIEASSNGYGVAYNLSATRNAADGLALSYETNPRGTPL